VWVGTSNMSLYGFRRKLMRNKLMCTYILLLIVLLSVHVQPSYYR